jgi:hypothetical protein
VLDVALWIVAGVAVTVLVLRLGARWVFTRHSKRR